MLEHSAGRDVSEAFQSYHPAAVRDLLSQFLVGRLPDAAQPADAAPVQRQFSGSDVKAKEDAAAVHLTRRDASSASLASSELSDATCLVADRCDQQRRTVDASSSEEEGWTGSTAADSKTATGNISPDCVLPDAAMHTQAEYGQELAAGQDAEYRRVRQQLQAAGLFRPRLRPYIVLSAVLALPWVGRGNSCWCPTL